MTKSQNFISGYDIIMTEDKRKQKTSYQISQTSVMIKIFKLKQGVTAMKKFEQWNGFKGRLWTEEINVRDFIQNNYTPYDGDASFLEGPTEATEKLWNKLSALQIEARKKGGV